MNMLLKRKQGLFRNRQPKAFLIRFARTVKSNCSDSRRVVPQQMEMDGFLNLWIIKPGPANKMIIKKGIEFTITEGQTDQTIKKNQWRKKIKACCWVLTQLRTKKVCCVRKKKNCCVHNKNCCLQKTLLCMQKNTTVCAGCSSRGRGISISNR